MTSDNDHVKSVPDIVNTLNEIASAVMYAAEGRSLDQVLERIAQVSSDLVNARYAALGVPDGKGGLRHFRVTGMSEEQIRRMGHLPVGKGLLGAILHDHQPIRLERMKDDPRSAGFCAGHPHMTSFLGVPILVDNQLLGILYLCDRRDSRPFSEDDQRLIETMAGYAALAIVGAQLGEQQRRLALLEERERIGMELHDGVIQSLYAIGMHLDLLRTAGRIEPGDLQPTIGSLNQVIEDIRRYILNLKSSSQRTIYGYFRGVLDRLHVPSTIQVEIDAPDQPPPFTPATYEGICQIANEAISNAVRHASASRIQIAVQQDHHLFQITISDNGQGFDLEEARQRDGLGLHNMQQRALLYGGKVSVESAPGKGTNLTITIPLRAI